VATRTDDGGTPRRKDGLSRARRILLTALSAEVAVLVVTGIALFFVYRPSVGQSWPGLFDRHANPSRTIWSAAGVRLLHQLAPRWLASSSSDGATISRSIGRGLDGVAPVPTARRRSRTGVRGWSGAAVLAHP
jgi:hypothetical protein